MKCYFNVQFGWGFSVGSGQNRVRMKGFRTDLQAFEARKRVLLALSAGEPVPSEAQLRRDVPEFLDETRGTVRPRPIPRAPMQPERITMHQRNRA